MKQKLQMIIGASAATFLALSAMAQDTSKTVASNITPGVNQRDGQKNTTEATGIIGMTVNNFQNVKLGTVVDLAVDAKTGRILEVILSKGGFLGIGITYTAVPPEALHQEAGLKVLRMDASVAKFKAAPGFDSAKWNLSTQSSRVAEMYAYYGLQPDFVPGNGDISMSIVSLGTELSQDFGMPNNIANGSGSPGMDKSSNTSKSSEGFVPYGHIDAFCGFALDFPVSHNYQFTMISPVPNPRNASPVIVGRAVKPQPVPVF
jgi:sporulation protein YlmC with PRC-barrel domain